ncbi:MAG: hypothetical protein FJZ16_09805, partial [Candidatus Omnitrophica bacterium]|nr:hypothetical protein [Candidatus Omnitrophota bacterium]
NGDHILIQIHDPSIQSRFTRPSHKSSGFQTFFVLSMMINARKYNNPSDSFIFLFDEPGIYLHPYAQLDLQRSFEAASDTAQIVYTTHSLFLISKNHPNRNRVVSKTLSGTKIDQKPFQKNWKSVRESLGILLCNNFLIAEKSLLVEGPSDVIYLYDVVKRLKEKNKVDIDLNDFSVVDAGSPDSYIAMAKLMLSEGRNVVALCDGDPSGKKNVNKLRKCCQKELREKTMKIIPLPENKSIEDICADINLLRDSIKKLSEELTSSGERKYVPGLNIDTEILKIKADPLKSLGLTINKTTRLWYKPEDELSKLSIAMIYEELAEKGSPPISRSAQELVKNLKELMELKGEKSADKGVFEEIKS